MDNNNVDNSSSNGAGRSPNTSPGAAPAAAPRRKACDSAALARVTAAADALKRGGFVILIDDPRRENEGDLVCAGEFATPEAVNFMKREARGLICVPMTRERLEELALEPMVAANTGLHNTAFTVSVDALSGTTTGISAHDISVTIQRLADPAATAADFGRPGHVFPLAAAEGGTLRRRGQTEGSLDLCRIAGLAPVAAICEMVSADGTMARTPELTDFASEHSIPLVHISDIVFYRRVNEELVTLIDSARLPTDFGEFTIHGFEVPLSGEHHVAIVAGDLAEGPPPLVRVHSECLTGDVFHSRRCDCGDQLAWAMRMIAAEGRGAVIYLRQEGRGIGLLNKIRAYHLQDSGMDTVAANLALGLPADSRDYGVGAQILRQLSAHTIRLITNNPEKVVQLEACGVDVSERVPVPYEVMYDSENAKYLAAKIAQMGHIIEVPGAQASAPASSSSSESSQGRTDVRPSSSSERGLPAGHDPAPAAEPLLQASAPASSASSGSSLEPSHLNLEPSSSSPVPSSQLPDPNPAEAHASATPQASAASPESPVPSLSSLADTRYPIPDTLSPADKAKTAAAFAKEHLRTLSTDIEAFQAFADFDSRKGGINSLDDLTSAADAMLDEAVSARKNHLDAASESSSSLEPSPLNLEPSSPSPKINVDEQLQSKVEQGALEQGASPAEAAREADAADTFVGADAKRPSSSESSLEPSPLNLEPSPCDGDIVDLDEDIARAWKWG